MARPLIGVTSGSCDKPGRCQVQADYTTAVEKAGGLPMIIPFHSGHDLIPEIVDALDGILFTGGDDLDPSLYGQGWHPKAIPIDPVRQAFELALLKEVERRRLPVLGICLGSQLINVYRGGTLHQFLPEVPRMNPLEHRKLDRESPRHPVVLKSDSQLAGAMGRAEISANTYHKQAAARMGRGLCVVGTASDGIVEAFEDPAYGLFAAVQWHPERLHAEAEHLGIFRLLVEKSRR
jgi:putative glutamine amidotransferase